MCQLCCTLWRPTVARRLSQTPVCLLLGARQNTVSVHGWLSTCLRQQNIDQRKPRHCRSSPICRNGIDFNFEIYAQNRADLVEVFAPQPTLWLVPKVARDAHRSAPPSQGTSTVEIHKDLPRSSKELRPKPESKPLDATRSVSASQLRVDSISCFYILIDETEPPVSLP
jgi:hypothetical protein